MRHQALNRDLNLRRLPFHLRLDGQRDGVSTNFSKAPGKTVVGHFPVSLPIRRLSKLLWHVTGLTGLPPFFSLGFLPRPQQVGNLAFFPHTGEDIVTCHTVLGASV